MASQNKNGFTIVELLIVIVVIGILAAITIVAYNGIQERARASSVSSALSQATQKLAVYQVDNPDVYPADKTALEALGVKDTPSITYQYTRTSSTPNTYCMTATIGKTSYKVSSSSAIPSAGGCAGHGVGGIAAITNLVKNPSLESNLTGWAFHTSITGSRVQTGGKWTAVGTRTATGATAIYAGRNDLSQVTIGNTYTASAIVTSSITQDVRIEVRNNTSSITSFAPTTYSLTANVPQRIFTTGVVSDSTVHVTIWWQNGAIGDTVTADEVMLVEGSTNYPYADGATANWTWNGTPDNSTSTGPPL